MGILRTDKISGLETPTAVTGSVVFDGTGDYLEVQVGTSLGTSDFTCECWIYPISGGHNEAFFGFGGGGSVNNFQLSVGTTGALRLYYKGIGASDYVDIAGALTFSSWNHVVFSGNSGSELNAYVNGEKVSTISYSYNYSSTTLYRFGLNRGGVIYYDGYISNLRVIKGKELYTSNFTPPTHELEVIGDTVLLCCNNPDSAGAEATGKTITVNGNAAASTFSPGLTRDFTYGTEFKGVTTFDTQGYFVPPSGTTEQRGRGRGVFGGGVFPSPFSNKNTIDYIEIHTEGNAQDFGDLPTTTRGQGGCSSSTRGLFFSGYSSGALDQIEFVTIHTTGNALDFGNLTVARTYAAGASSNTRGIFAGGYAHRDVIDYVTIAALGDAVDFGNLNAGTGGGMGSVQSPTRAVFAGGYVPASKINTIQYITIASTGDATDFGDLINATNSMGGVSSQTRGVFTGGVISPSTIVNSMEYITIASTGNSQDFGDLVEVRQAEASASNTIRGVSAGGITPSGTNAIDFVVIATTGNANSFGDLTERRGQTGGCSDSHGGLS